MTAEHFVTGSGEGRSSEPVTLLGHTAPVDFSPEGSADSADKLHDAESHWYSPTKDWDGDWGSRTLIKPARFVKASTARDLVGEAIFHPHMDEIPGIEKVRDSFHPEKTVKIISGAYHVDPDAWGHVNEDGMTLRTTTGREAPRTPTNAPPPADRVPLAIVTHETAHLALNSDQFRGVTHQWPMARTHIHVVRALLGDKHATALKDHYERLGVNFGG